jgi:hypothetical protein
MERTVLTAAWILVAGGLLATGCGSGSSTKTGGAPTGSAVTSVQGSSNTVSPTASNTVSTDGAQASGACRLITGSEAERALGVSTQPTTNKDLGVQNGLQHDTCAYAGTNFQRIVTVQLFTGSGASADFTQQQRTYANKAKPVNGVGDEAFQLLSTATGPGRGELRFRKGPNEVQIQIKSDNSDTDTRLLELGRAAAARL